MVSKACGRINTCWLQQPVTLCRSISDRFKSFPKPHWLYRSFKWYRNCRNVLGVNSSPSFSIDLSDLCGVLSGEIYAFSIPHSSLRMTLEFLAGKREHTGWCRYLLLFDPGFNWGSHIAFGCYVCFVSFNLELFSLSLSFLFFCHMELLRRVQVSCFRLHPIPNLSDSFFIIRLSLNNFGTITLWMMLVLLIASYWEPHKTLSGNYTLDKYILIVLCGVLSTLLCSEDTWEPLMTAKWRDKENRRTGLSIENRFGYI